MNGTVHALQHGLQPLQSLYRDSKPQRAEVEAAIRTISSAGPATIPSAKA